MEALKSAVALAPTSILLYGSVVLFRTQRSLWVSLQFIGSGFLFIVVITHVCEALSIFESMGWVGGWKTVSVITLISEVLCLV
jgi:hypothetical protein